MPGRKERIKHAIKRTILYKIVYNIMHLYHLSRHRWGRMKEYIMNLLFYYTHHHNKAEGKSVLFYFTNWNFGLPCFPLIYYYHSSGYSIFLKHKYSFISRCVFGMKMILKMQNFHILFRNPGKLRFDAYFYDQDSFINKTNADRKYLLYNYFEISAQGSSLLDVFHSPYPMHPMVYDRGIYLKIESYRNVERKMKLFYSGNTHRATYTFYNIKEKYNMLDRLEIIDAIKKEVPDTNVYVAESKAFLDSVFLGESDYCNKIMMIDWQWKIEQGKYDLRIENEDWLYFLSRADFFLACPGVKIPFCHNIIESMSVGTIPFTNYGHLFDPPLEDMKNAVIFNTISELVEKIDVILHIDKHEIAIMRKNVLDYYDSFLDPERFCRVLMKYNGESAAVVLYSEQFEE